MKHRESKTKLIVLMGWLLLVGLLLTGVGGILYHLQQLSSDIQNENKKEDLVTVSRVLATLYTAESMGNVIFFPESKIDLPLIQKKDSLMTTVENGIAILKHNAENEEFVERLDTVEVLLKLKDDNEQQIMIMIDSMMQLPDLQRKKTTILSKKQLQNLMQSVRNNEEVQDTSFFVTRKKSFGEKFLDLFRGKTQEHVTLSSHSRREIADSVAPLSSSVDTIEQYVTDLIYKKNLKNSLFLARIATRQTQLQATNEMLFNKISLILRSLEEKDYRAKEQLIAEQNMALRLSTKIGYWVAIAALALAIIFLFFTIRLINAQRDYRRELERKQKQIEDLLKNREWLMLSISHDIKSPLASIVGTVDLMQQSVSLKKQENNHLYNIKNSSKQILELVTNLVDFHKLEQGKITVNASDFAPQQLIDELYQTFQPVAQSKSLQLNLINEIDAAEIYYNDVLRLRQILNNLVSNALKFTSKGAVSISASIDKSSEKAQFIVIVKDTGVGIAKENLSYLFKEFGQIQNTGVPVVDGAGLGLSVSQQLAHLLQGNINVESTLGEGSTFTLQIPITTKESGEKEESLPAQSTKTYKLLFVDDDKVLLKVCEEMAKQLGNEVVVCDRAVNVMNVLKDNRFDIVFCDIKMPEIDGFELLHTIKETYPTLPVVALSGYSNISSDQLKAVGYAAFLEKPFSLQQLATLIEEVSKYVQVDVNQEVKNNALSKFSALVKYADGDKTAEKMILKTFVSENVAIIKGIKDAVTRNAVEELKELAHKIKPRMKMINDKEVVKILKKIETGENVSAEVEKLILLIKQHNSEVRKIIKAFY
ncbi:MAG: response regulator [Prevotellaceae bacterium]|jgi:signal transduction histidine kinase/FixJ family two-component response regulator|nr:response regulator [Prevotellaceae bacterium]